MPALTGQRVHAAQCSGAVAASGPGAPASDRIWTPPAEHGTRRRMNAYDLIFAPGPDTDVPLRHAFGRFGTGVTVITTQSEIGPLGFTANSFSSVSLAPPLVLWSLSNTSRRHDAFAQAQHFSIHVLTDAQADMALHFAANGEGFDAYPHDIDAQGVPLLHGCLARFDCTHHASHPAGDHSIILGRVTQVATKATGAGLAFDQGQYGRFQPF
ncbi:flavin reductase family protein [Pseudosulfitobacter pseudonitzschiae]|nr:flavin reductase family protein [Pseudosulfitobacter pseudonitzschiae]